jgi:large repetitive protein
MSKPTRSILALSLAFLSALALLALDYQITAAQDNAPDTAPAVASDQNAIRINEIMASNKKTLVDPDEPGETPDWFELFNPGPGAVSLDGLGLADGEPLESGFVLTSGLTIRAGGFLVFYADNDTSQGPLHTNFALSAGGESVILYKVATKQVIDQIDFPALDNDQSFGRIPDGSGAPDFLPAASPGSTNAMNPPLLKSLTKPPYPAPVDAPVTVSATVTDNGAVAGVTLYYSTPVTGEQAVQMVSMGEDLYQAAIPGQPADTLVTYYVQAVDDEGDKARTPLPGRERRYLTGYVAPRLLINEMVVENKSQYVDPDEPLETPDWIELYNPGPAAVSLDGLSLTDDKDLPLRFVIPAGLSLDAGERMAFLADDDKGQNTIRGNQPPLHLPFNLNKSSAYVGLFGGEGSVRIDFYDIDDPTPFGIVARIPDGGPWSMSVCPSFNAPNVACDSRMYAPAVKK